jgi:hypothetical protein
MLLVIYGWVLGVGALAAVIVWGLVWINSTNPTQRSQLRRGGRSPLRIRPRDAVRGGPRAQQSRVIHSRRSLRAETIRICGSMLALDRCTDDTAALARVEIGDDARFELVEVDFCPPDWAGKVHAVHAGVTRSARADAAYLLFADAVRPSRQAASRRRR